MNRSKIEWCDHTWNPITGCRHNCEYCYARRMAVRFAGNVKLNKMAKRDYSLIPAANGGEDLYVLDAPMLNETGKPLVYPFGFDPTLHRYRMDMPEKLKMGNNIFVGAMSDMFGDWIPDEWIQEIFGTCQKYSIHNYMFLTKNPKRYECLQADGMLPAVENLWYGSTLTRPEDQRFLSKLHHTFWSIEPIHAPFRIFECDEVPPDWIIIGAETGRRKEKIVPSREWIEDIVKWCDKSEIPVFMKDSLCPIVGKNNMRREIPMQLQQSELSPKMKKRLLHTCAGCKADFKKSDMVALLARTRRGEQPKQYGFMCHSCFKEYCKNYGLDASQTIRLEQRSKRENV